MAFLLPSFIFILILSPVFNSFAVKTTLSSFKTIANPRSNTFNGESVFNFLFH